MNRICSVLSIVLIVFACPMMAGSSDGSAHYLTAQPVGEILSSGVNPGRIFVPMNCPFGVRISVPSESPVPSAADIKIIITDNRKNTWLEYRFAPEFEQSDTALTMNRVIRIPELPSSREVNIQAHLVDRKSGKPVPFPGKSEKSEPVTLFTVYAVRFGMIQSEGWYLPELDESGNRYRWCRARGKLEFPVLPWPVFLDIHGHAPLESLPGKTLNLTLENESGAVYSLNLAEPEFSIQYLIQPPPGHMSPFPLNYRSLWLQGDQTFVPETKDSDEHRILSFSADTVILTCECPVVGFYEDTRAKGEVFTAPAISVKLPGPDSATHLYIQGRREIRCQPDPQTLEVYAGNQKLHESEVTGEYFAIRIPVPETLRNTTDPVTLNMKVYPMYFRVECGDSNDDRPYGLALTEICFR